MPSLRHWFCAAVSALLVVFSLARSASAEDAPAATAISLRDLTIPTGELHILLTPLTLSQLKVEVEGWFQLVQAAAKRVSDAELDAKRSARKKTKAEEEAERQQQEAQRKEQEEKAAAAAEEKRREAAASASASATAAASSGVPVLPPPPAKPVKAPVKEKERAKKEIATIAQLHTRRIAMVDRFEVVLAAYGEKGGDVGEYKKYLKAITGVTVDADDVGGTWKTVAAWAQSKEGGHRLLRNVAVFGAMIVAFVLLALVGGWVTRRAIRNITRWSSLLKDFVVATVRRLLLLSGFLVALSALEVDTTPIFALVGAAGLVLGLALQGTLGNLASGLMILAYRPFDVGDLIETSGVTGVVQTMNMFSTTLMTLDNRLVVVPNNSVWSGVITNVTGSDKRRVDLMFGVSYRDKGSRVIEVLNEVLASEPLVLEEPEPLVAMHELADSSVKFICRPWVNTVDYWEAYWRITRTVKETFDREGISIPFPQRDVHVIKAPDNRAPEAKAPEAKAPEAKAPDPKAPDPKAPDKD